MGKLRMGGSVNGDDMITGTYIFLSDTSSTRYGNKHDIWDKL